MSLTGIHTNWISFIPTYKNDRDYLLKVAENNQLFSGQNIGLTPYYDGKSIAIGYGFDLLANPIEYVDYFLGTIGIILTQVQKDQITAAKSDPSATTAAQLASFLNFGDWVTGEPKASTLLRNVLENNSGDPSVIGKEKQLEIFLANQLQVTLTESREKAVLVSMWYQAAGVPGVKGGYFLNKDGTLTNMSKALQADDRAEVWYQIRYGSSKNGADGLGVVKRRYFEADYFGLYDDGVINSTSMNDENAKSAFRTYTRHKAVMDDYESRFSAQISAANSDYGISLVQTLTADLANARAYLTAQYGQGINITGDILVGEDDGSTTGIDTRYYRNTDADVLTGSGQSDLIFGESGNDVLEGREGADVLYGGSGVDIYRIRPGDGNDILKDEDGKGAVVYDPNGSPQGLAAGLRKPTDPAGEWKSPDGQFIYRWSGTPGDDLTIQTPTGTVRHIERAYP